MIGRDRIVMTVPLIPHRVRLRLGEHADRLGQIEVGGHRSISASYVSCQSPLVLAESP